MSVNGSSSGKMLLGNMDNVNLAIHGLFAVLGFILNGITILIILKGNDFGRGMKIQLANLAIADFLCSLLTPGSGLVGGIITMPYTTNLVLCKLQQYITAVTYYSSLLCSAAISLERLVAVYFPLKMLSYQRSNVIVVIATIWISAFVLHLDSVMENKSNEDVKNNNIGSCTKGRYLLMEDIEGPLVYIGVCRFLIPVITILVSYGLISIKLIRRKRVGEKHKFNNPQRNHVKVIIMLAVDGILSIITWTPYMIPILIPSLESSNTDGTDSDPPLYKMAFFGLMLTNCFTTPIIYLIFSRDFKRDGRNMLSEMGSRCCSCKQKKYSITIVNTPDAVGGDKMDEWSGPSATPPQRIATITLLPGSFQRKD